MILPSVIMRVESHAIVVSACGCVECRVCLASYVENATFIIDIVSNLQLYRVGQGEHEVHIVLFHQLKPTYRTRFYRYRQLDSTRYVLNLDHELKVHAYKGDGKKSSGPKKNNGGIVVILL